MYLTLTYFLIFKVKFKPEHIDVTFRSANIINFYLLNLPLTVLQTKGRRGDVFCFSFLKKIPTSFIE